MKKFAKISKTLVFVVLLIFLSCEAKIVNSLNSEPLLPISRLHNSFFSYIEMPPIVIDHELDFSSYGFSGSGTSVSPYIIEGLNITSDVQGIAGISIEDVSVYFEIRNCLVNVTGSAITIIP